jgi:hypothetical protein
MPISKINPNSLGGVPCFSAYRSTNQSVTQNVWTKIQCNVEEYDTANAYDNATNYRFQPQVAGYYQINASADASGSGSSTFQTLSLYKNGSSERSGDATRDNGGRVGMSIITYLNGSTDYVELYAYLTATSPAWAGAQQQTFFQGIFLRAA